MSNSHLVKGGRVPCRARLAAIGAAIGAMLSVAAPAVAQPSADPASMFPERVLAYVSWCGADAAKIPFAGTSLARMLGDPDVRPFAESIAGPLFTLIQKSAEATGSVPAELNGPIQVMLEHFWRRPCAVALIDANPADANNPFQALFIAQVGGEGSLFRAAWDKAVAALAKSGAKLKPLGGDSAGWSEVTLAAGMPVVAISFERDWFRVAIGAQTPRVIGAAVASGKSLAAYEDFRSVQRALNVDFMRCPIGLYADLNRARLRLLRPGAIGDATSSMMLIAISQMLGLQPLSSAGAALSFADADLRYSFCLRDGGVRRGLLRAFAQRPIEDRDFHAVPADAKVFCVRRLDLKGFIAGLTDGVAASGPSSPPPADSPMAALMQAPAVKVIADELAPALGDTWVISDSAANGGIAFLGASLCVEVRDGARARQAMKKLVKLILQEAELPAAEIRTVRDARFEIDMIDLREAPVPFAPAWGIADRWLVVSLYPPMTRAMMAHLGGPNVAKNCILSNPRFAARRATLPKDAMSLTYADPAALVGTFYDAGIPALSAMAAELNVEGFALDRAQFPMRESILRYVQPAISLTRADESAVLMETRASLPLVTASVVEAAVLSPLLVGAMVPSLVRTTEVMDRTAGAATLKTVGMAIHAYAADHNQNWPPKLADALSHAGETASRSAAGSAGLVMVQGLPSADRIDNPTRCVLVYERPSRYDGKGTNVFFVDGHVAWRTADQFEADLNATQQMMRGAPGGASSASRPAVSADRP